jgi:hypothetical protein
MSFRQVEEAVAAEKVARGTLVRLLQYMLS